MMQIVTFYYDKYDGYLLGGSKNKKAISKYRQRTQVLSRLNGNYKMEYDYVK